MPNYTNRLLLLMSEEDLASMGAAELVSLDLKQHLEPTGGDEREWIYFIEQGIASVVADTAGKAAVELGLIGPEGMSGLGAVYGDPATPFQSFMQVEGVAYRFRAAEVSVAIAKRATLRGLLLRYARSFAIQVASTALANGRGKLDERLCRWLLMVSDRVGPRFAITHEFISLMLSVRRSGVTLALQILEGNGLIRATRGNVSIIDREGLIAASNGTYGFAEAEYERLLGVSLAAAATLQAGTASEQSVR